MKLSIKGCLKYGILLIMIGGMLLFFPCITEVNAIAVPDPRVDLYHEYNKEIDYTPPFIMNEVYDLWIQHGEFAEINCQAANITESDNKTNIIRYQHNIDYKVNGSRYLYQITTGEIRFNHSDESVTAYLGNCSSFDVNLTDIYRTEGIPMLNFTVNYYNITTENTDSNNTSNIDLRLEHNFRFYENKITVKIKIKIDLSKFIFIQPSTRTELPAGSLFDITVKYGISLLNATDNKLHNPVIPSEINSTNLIYDVQDNNGRNITIGLLDMGRNFSVKTQSGSEILPLYSELKEEGNGVYSGYNHFKGLIYGNTTEIESDPEITVIHNGVTTGLTSIDAYPYIIPTTFISVTIYTVVVSIVHKRKKT